MWLNWTRIDCIAKKLRPSPGPGGPRLSQWERPPLQRRVRVTIVKNLALLRHLPTSFAGEFFGFRNQLYSLEYLWIVFKQDTGCVGNTELVIKNFVLDLSFDERPIGVEI